MKRVLVLVTILVLAVLASGVLLAQSSPLVGTWKLNTAKSKYSPGPGPKSQTRTVEAQGDGIKVRIEGTAGDGSHVAYGYTANFDGKDNPMSGIGAPNGADTVALKRINPTTIEVTNKKAGKVLVTLRVEVSKDGKVTTITANGTNGNGQVVHNATVYEKQ